MTLRWTVRNKLVALASVGVIVSLGLTATAYWGFGRLVDAVDDIVHDTRVQRHQMEMDQLHDTLRGDVLEALAAAERKDDAEQARILGEMSGHGKNIRKLFGDLRALHLSPVLDRAVGEAERTVDAYAREAEAIAPLAFQDRGAALGRLGEFMALYRTVERQMAKITDLIAEETKASQSGGSAAVGAAKWAMGTILALAIVVLGVIAVVITRSIVAPLGHAVILLRDIAEGEGDLTKRLDATRRDEIGELARWFNTFVDKLQGIMAQVREAAAQVAGASQELSGSTVQLSAGAQEQASSLEQTAASLEEITGTVRQNADNARQANQLAVGARGAAEQGGQVVTSAVQGMAEITEASRKIAAIIGTIDEIAFQTNLLALNAAVEAARAGEQGRGFAVVASEVRNLAQRSAEAAKEIKDLIGDSVGKVETGAELVNRSGQTLEEIVIAVKRVTDVISEISAASQQQSQGIDQVNRAVTQMDQVVQSNAAQTEELTSTAQALAGQAQMLQTLVGRFRLDAAAARSFATAEQPGLPIAETAPTPVPRRATSRATIPTHVVSRGRPTVSTGHGAAHVRAGDLQEF